MSGLDEVVPDAITIIVENGAVVEAEVPKDSPDAPDGLTAALQDSDRTIQNLFLLTKNPRFLGGTPHHSDR